MPTNFWTWFWPSFWNTGWNNQQMTTPTKQQKFPWLSDDQIKRLESLTSNPQEQQKLYQQAIQQLKQQNTADNRIAAENEMNYRSMNEKNPQQANYLQSNVRLEQLADLTKGAFWLDAGADTQQVVNWLMAMAQDNWVSLSLLNDYLDHWDEEFLYQMGLKQDPALQTNPEALSIKWSIANAPEDKWEWNDNLFGRFETEQYDKDAWFLKNYRTLSKNTVKSAANVLSDVWNMIVNPLDTAGALAKTAVGWTMNLFGIDDDIQYMQDWKLKDWYMSANDTADAVWEFFKERYWGWDEILNTLFTDPAWVISDVATIVEWGAGILRWVAKWTAKAAAKAWVKWAARTLENVAETAGKVSKFAGTYDPYAVAMRLETQLPMKAISTTVDVAKKIPWASAKMKNSLNGALDKAVGLDSKTKLAIQSNPFSKEVWQKAKTYIDTNGLPEKSTEVSKQLITDVADRVQETMLKQMDELGETWPMYQPLREAWYTVDLTPAKAELPEVLNKYGITVDENGKLDFSRTAISSEAKDIQKLYNWLENADDMSMDEYLRFRSTAKDMVTYNPMNKNQIWKKVADTPWDQVIKAMRETANKYAHEQVAPLKDLDALYKKQSDLIQEVTDWIVYKDASKAGTVRDNINQIIKNLDEPNRRVLKNRLEKVLPWIEEEVKAINMLPKLIDNYYKPSKVQKWATTSAWTIVGNAIGWVPWAVIWAWVGYWLSGKIDKLKSAKWEKVISGTSKEWAEKLADIQKRIANNEKITAAQKKYLQEISAKLKDDKDANLTRIIADVASADWDNIMATLDKAIRELESMKDTENLNEIRDLRDSIQKQADEEAEMNRYAQDFEAEKQSIINESSDQRLPEFKRRIYQLEQQEQRVGTVAGKKIWKTFEGNDYKKAQDTAWLKKKEQIIKDIEEYYNVDQFEAIDIYDRIYKAAWPDDLYGAKTAKYQVADQTNTPEFKKRFEWSKVVDKEGKPMVVYHWTPNEWVNVFDRKKIWTSTDSWVWGRWFYFTPDKDYAKSYTKRGWKVWELKEAYVDIKKPFEIELNDKSSIDRFNEYYMGNTPSLEEVFKKWLQKKYGELVAQWYEKGTQSLRDAGYDGVIVKEWWKIKEVVAFDSNQIKSATDNIGTFDKNNPDIRYQKYWVSWQWEKWMTATEWLNIRNFKNWKTVKELANQYWIDTKIVDSISTPEWQRAYWMYWDRLITLSKDLVESTVPHELLHGVFDMVDSKRRTSILEWIQKKLNIDNVQAEEWLADNFSEYYRTGKFWTKWLAKWLVEKVKQFFYEVKSYIDWTYKNEKQIRQLFDDIIDWKIEWEYGVYSDPKFQSVWHGSPADFEKFDSSHMGEWEWAQAHGWGHYVAKDKATWEHYADMVDKWWYRSRYKWKTRENIAQETRYDKWPSELNSAYEIVKRMDYDNMSFEEARDAAIKTQQNTIDMHNNLLKYGNYEDYWWSKERLENYVKEENENIKILKSFNEKDFEIWKKNLYEVEIPDPIKKDTPTWSNYLEEDSKIWESARNKIADALEKEEHDYVASDRAINSIRKDEWVGWALYKQIRMILWSDKKASKFLEKLWYDWIHYFWGRDWEAYVIFNDDALQITKHHKY